MLSYWRPVCFLVGNIMIQEEKKDLIDRQEFYQNIAQKMSEKDGKTTLNSTLNLREILEIFAKLSTQDELSAVWILDGSIWRCSWCKTSALESYGNSFPSRHCPYCGRRMKLEGNLGSKN